MKVHRTFKLADFAESEFRQWKEGPVVKGCELGAGRNDWKPVVNE